MSIASKAATTHSRLESNFDQTRNCNGLRTHARTNQLAPLDRQLGPIQYVDIDALTAYSNNPRKHPEKQIVKLMASISEYGIALPILIDTNQIIIVGAGVIEAARRLGIEKVPVIVADQWSPDQVQAYRLIDNRLAELSIWDEQVLKTEFLALLETDFETDLLGWETAEIDLLLLEAKNDEPDDDPADQIPVSSGPVITRTDDLWLLGKHRLLCGSSLDSCTWDRLMDGHQAAMGFTDAPYNVRISGHVSGLGKKKHAEFQMASGEMSTAEFTTFLTEAVARMSECLCDGAILDFCMDWRGLAQSFTALDANGLALINMCVWNKSNGGMGSLYRSKHELVLIAKKGKAPHTNNVELGKHGRYRTNVWDYAGANSFGRNRDTDLADHPTVKPVALVADAIRDVSRIGDIVIDAFMGSGTTILAAERTKRIAYGIDIEPVYVDVAIRRWQTLTGRDAVHAETGETFAEVSERRAAETPVETTV